MIIATTTIKLRTTITVARHEKTTIAVYDSNNSKTKRTTIATKHENTAIAMAVARSIIGGADSHIFMFTDHA